MWESQSAVTRIVVQKQQDIMICENSESELDKEHHEFWAPKLQSK